MISPALPDFCSVFLSLGSAAAPAGILADAAPADAFPWTLLCALLACALAGTACVLAAKIFSALKDFQKEAEVRGNGSEAFEKTVRAEYELTRTALAENLSNFRTETANANTANSAAFNKTLAENSSSLNTTLHERFESFTQTLAGNAKLQSDALENFRKAQETAAAQTRTEITGTLEKIREGTETALERVRTESAKKLEEIRGVVDEKLQSTLEKRIGESFKLVSERLENVYKSLGEMQTVSTSVNDLKRVLSNVKARGTFGEVQLGALLEDFLAPEEFVKNFKPRPRGNEIVEFAVKLPGTDADSAEPVYLPIDSKFPIEDYSRIAEAAEKADTAGADAAANALAKRVEGEAADIARKYINPPLTTNFAILFVPTEGIYAELIRRNGFCEKILREKKVLIAGPTTLAALLNSLRVGFQTLKIQKNSKKIEDALRAVQKDFKTFSELLGTLGKNLDSAQTTLGKISDRHQKASKKLEKFEEIDAAGAPAIAESVGNND